MGKPVEGRKRGEPRHDTTARTLHHPAIVLDAIHLRKTACGSFPVIPGVTAGAFHDDRARADEWGARSWWPFFGLAGTPEREERTCEIGLVPLQHNAEVHSLLRPASRRPVGPRVAVVRWQEFTIVVNLGDHAAMGVLVQKPAPDFEAQAVMPDGSFQQVKLSHYKGKYVLLFFYPLDFTFVCPTEIIAFSDRVKEFESRNVQVLGASVDSHFSHLAWRNTPRQAGGIGDIQYPLIADINKKISADYDVLLEGGVSLRGLFLIDKDGVVRHQVVNDLPLGRSVDEALRMVDALQFFEQNGEVCPADWKQGARTIKPTVDQSKEFFSAQYAG
jgi:alkyl hydroperoxide reductase subunit AhpC